MAYVLLNFELSSPSHTTFYTSYNYKSLAWSIPSGPGSENGTSQAAVFSGPPDSRSLEDPFISYFQERLGLYTWILGPTSNIFKVNATPSHSKEVYLNKSPNSQKPNLTKPNKNLYVVFIRMAAASSSLWIVPLGLCQLFQIPVLGLGKGRGQWGPRLSYGSFPSSVGLEIHWALPQLLWVSPSG